ncbi:uncharacterized protein LOC107266889 [Cephus cinctus]|uniref:Uncharacterized protein LOC107266889 n=1 Tax=Cephus cinctus TaxID=211228 RepID=A0AAJ7BSL3_CEPCN|nr:uncharacterized protein LOC107266889 [Cephus cinctus]
MSARVLNPAMMTEMSRNLGGARAVPSQAAVARIRRDLFGPVDHAAAKALAERELKAQSRLDADKWGFDFHLELPRSNSQYTWEIVTSQDVVPEPYALRGMPYLRKHAPGTPRKSSSVSPRLRRADTALSVSGNTSRKSERTPPQEPRVPEIGARTIETTPEDPVLSESNEKKSCVPEEPTTPILPVSARKQSSITDYMKSRKRALNGSAKSMAVEPPEKISRNAGQIRS